MTAVLRSLPATFSGLDQERDSPGAQFRQCILGLYPQHRSDPADAHFATQKRGAACTPPAVAGRDLLDSAEALPFAHSCCSDPNPANLGQRNPAQTDRPVRCFVEAMQAKGELNTVLGSRLCP